MGGFIAEEGLAFLTQDAPPVGLALVSVKADETVLGQAMQPGKEVLCEIVRCREKGNR